MNNYSNNQIDNNIYNPSDNLNQYNGTNLNGQNGLMNISNNMYNKSQSDINMLGGLTNENLINLANTIEPATFNGTSLDIYNGQNQNYITRGKNDDNTSLIKSLTKEIINNLKENNMSLYDNSSINSRIKSYSNPDDNDTNYSSNSVTSSNSKLSQKKKLKKKDIKETIEDFVTNETSSLTPVGYVGWFFDECFNYKDFLVLFIIYFILSQEMIKDFFSKYFNCLNPDTEGKVGIQGVIIYGLILTVLFMLVRKLI